MKHLIFLAACTIGFSLSVSAQPLSTGNCEGAAQAVLDTLNKVNQSNSTISLQGQPGQVERYTSADGSYAIVTGTGRGEGQCFVTSVDYNPAS